MDNEAHYKERRNEEVGGTIRSDSLVLDGGTGAEEVTVKGGGA